MDIISTMLNNILKYIIWIISILLIIIVILLYKVYSTNSSDVSQDFKKQVYKIVDNTNTFHMVIK